MAARRRTDFNAAILVRGAVRLAFGMRRFLFSWMKITLRPGNYGRTASPAANSIMERGILLYMKTTWQIPTLFLGVALVFTPALSWGRQSDTNNGSAAKQDMKDAGHETGNAAKDAGRGTKHGTEKAYDSTKHGTEKGYNATKHGTKKAWSKTKNTTKGAVDGGKEGAHQPPQ
ncbi:MAG TPA: hypothetical protein VGF96_06025 [Terracidiphilus sp.]